MTIERLAVGDGERWRALRLWALRDAPDAFGTTLAEASEQSAASWDDELGRLATFVATANGRDLGVVRGAAHDQLRDAGYLISMWVAPDERRLGVGSVLVDAALEWARSRQLRTLFLDVSEGNSPAIALYTRKGFRPNGEVGTLPPPRQHVRELQMAYEF